MPVRYVIVKDRRLVVTTASGHVTFAELKTHQDRLLSDPDFNPEFNQLLDGTGVTQLDLSTDEVRMLASRRMFSPLSRRAFVAASPGVFGVARMAEAYFEISGSPSQIMVFSDMASALKWLGIESLPEST